MKLHNKVLIIICTLFLGALIMLNYSTDNYVTFSASDCVSSQSGEIIGEDGSVTIDETSQFNGGFLYSQVYNLKKGTYSLNVNYESDRENLVVVNSNLGQIYNQTLPPSSTVTTIDFQLSQDCDTVQFIFVYNGIGSLSIKDLTLAGAKPFFTDGILLGVLVILMGLCLYLYSNKCNGKDVILFLTIIIFVSYPLFTNYLIGGHDLNYHLSRIEGIKDGLIGGQFPVDIYPQTNFGYGYLGTLYPSLFLYFPAILRIIGVSMVTSYKTFLVGLNIVTIPIDQSLYTGLLGRNISTYFHSASYCWNLSNYYGEPKTVVSLSLCSNGTPPVPYIECSNLCRSLCFTHYDFFP